MILEQAGVGCKLSDEPTEKNLAPCAAPPSPFRGDAANLHASISGRFARSHVRPYSSELWMPRADGLWKPSKAYLSMRVRQVPSREASVYNDGEPTRQDDRRQDKHLFLAR
jgi:hypothetical protein